jgi:DNA-binding NtrC family response regulator
MQCESYPDYSFDAQVVIISAQEAKIAKYLSNLPAQVKFCRDIRQLNDLFINNNCSICIVDLTKDTFSLHSFTKEALKAPHVKWVAVVNDGQLKLDVVCHFVNAFCVDYFISPMDDERIFSELINHQIRMLKIKHQLYDHETSQEEDIIGDTKAIKHLRDVVRRVYPTDINVFLTGESGCGKLYLAKMIHSHSKRKGLPLYHINCRDIVDDDAPLIQPNIPFDGASPQQINGTLLLENIDSLSLKLQNVLLSYIKSSLWDNSMSYDLRLIATSSSDLMMETQSGQFNNELFNCFNVFKIPVPSLRERGNDILKLADSLLNRYCREYGGMTQNFSEEAKTLILRYSWPGNISQLMSQIKRASLLADGREIHKKHFNLPQELMTKQNLRVLRNEAEKDILKSVLDIHQGQVLSAAKELGISRATMYRLLEKHDIRLKNRDLPSQFDS